MAQKKRARERIWVELGVVVLRTGPALKPTRFAYALENPRTGSTIERSPFHYTTALEAINAGLAYLRATYNTGRSK